MAPPFETMTPLRTSSITTPATPSTQSTSLTPFTPSTPASRKSSKQRAFSSTASFNNSKRCRNEQQHQPQQQQHVQQKHLHRQSSKEPINFGSMPAFDSPQAMSPVSPGDGTKQQSSFKASSPLSFPSVKSTLRTSSVAPLAVSSSTLTAAKPMNLQRTTFGKNKTTSQGVHQWNHVNSVNYVFSASSPSLTQSQFSYRHRANSDISGQSHPQRREPRRRVNSAEFKMPAGSEIRELYTTIEANATPPKIRNQFQKRASILTLTATAFVQQGQQGGGLGSSGKRGSGVVAENGASDSGEKQKGLGSNGSKIVGGLENTSMMNLYKADAEGSGGIGGIGSIGRRSGTWATHSRNASLGENANANLIKREGRTDVETFTLPDGTVISDAERARIEAAMREIDEWRQKHASAQNQMLYERKKWEERCARLESDLEAAKTEKLIALEDKSDELLDSIEQLLKANAVFRRQLEQAGIEPDPLPAAEFNSKYLIVGDHNLTFLEENANIAKVSTEVNGKISELSNDINKSAIAITQLTNYMQLRFLTQMLDMAEHRTDQVRTRQMNHSFLADMLAKGIKPSTSSQALTRHGPGSAANLAKGSASSSTLAHRRIQKSASQAILTTGDMDYLTDDDPPSSHKLSKTLSNLSGTFRKSSSMIGLNQIENSITDSRGNKNWSSKSFHEELEGGIMKSSSVVFKGSNSIQTNKPRSKNSKVNSTPNECHQPQQQQPFQRQNSHRSGLVSSRATSGLMSAMMGGGPGL